MSDIDLAPLQEILPQYASQGRPGLLPALQAAQKHYGWLPREVAAEVGRALNVPLADVHGVIEFYSLFYNEPVGKKIIRVCTDAACRLKGGEAGIQPNQTAVRLSAHDEALDADTTIESAPCLGLCDHAPAVLTVDDGQWTVADGESRPESFIFHLSSFLTSNCGRGVTTSLTEYGGYRALEKARAMTPEAVVAEVKAAGLVGRGGAAFPTGIKWEGAAKAESFPKYIICNADESEPGTFKDRVLLLDDPHRTIEGMCIAAHAIGAEKGYIYLRGEYPYILPGLENALAEARAAGYLGEKFEIEIRLGAGAYICGEETALFESIEGKRGYPRIKPPFPTTNGLFNQPTVINNVETLCNVPLIIEKGAAGYRQIGTEKSPGPKLFCVSGDVAKPGVYEVPFGTTLRELLSMANGYPVDPLSGSPVEPDNRITDKLENNIQAILFGGAAGAFATQEHLDVKLTFEDLRAAGLPLGSGVVMVFDQSRDLRQTLAGLGHFFAHESCGKCYPCQMGTQRQKEILARIAEGKMKDGDLERLQDIGWTMTDASLCGLGQTAASAVLSAMKQFPGLFVEGQKSKVE
jgi:NADH-quinone oxidoreductase subunit F